MKLSSPFLAHLLCTICVVTAPNETEKLPTFGDVVNILGNMERTDQDFQDGLALDLFSPKNRTLTVTQNLNPLPGTFVSGTTGGPFLALANYSYIITLNESAQDLIAKIEIPYQPAMLAALDVQEGNTYVDKLAPDGLSWTIDESRRNIHRSENNTRIIKLVSLDGEYLLLGRKTVDTGNTFLQYGQGASRTFNLTGGQGRQEAEFVDGLRVSVIAEARMGVNVDLRSGIDNAQIPKRGRALNSFAWVVNTSDSNIGVNATMRFPVNPFMLEALGKKEGMEKDEMMEGNETSTVNLIVAWKPLNTSASSGFQSIDAQTQTTASEVLEDAILVKNMHQLDGEYIILIN